MLEDRNFLQYFYMHKTQRTTEIMEHFHAHGMSSQALSWDFVPRSP